MIVVENSIIKTFLKLTAVLGLAALMIPLGVNAQEQKHEQGKGAPAGRPAPAARAARAGGASSPGSARRAAAAGRAATAGCIRPNGDTTGPQRSVDGRRIYRANARAAAQPTT